MIGYIYSDTSGEILRVLDMAFESTLMDNVASGEGVYLPTEQEALQGYPVDKYIEVSSPQSLESKTASPATISGQIISNIYNPSTVDCGKLGTYEVTDGVFEFTIDTPGTYQITVKSVRFLDKTFEVVIS